MAQCSFDRRSLRLIVLAALFLSLAPNALAGPAGDASGNQKRQAVERLVFVCETNPNIVCPDDADDVGYCIEDQQLGRIYHDVCNLGLGINNTCSVDPVTVNAEACIPKVMGTVSATLTLTAEETPSPGCSGQPDCIDLEITVDLGATGSQANVSEQQVFTSTSSFLKKIDCFS